MESANFNGFIIIILQLVDNKIQSSQFTDFLLRFWKNISRWMSKTDSDQKNQSYILFWNMIIQYYDSVGYA